MMYSIVVKAPNGVLTKIYARMLYKLHAPLV